MGEAGVIPDGSALRLAASEDMIPPDGAKVYGPVDMELGGIGIEDASGGLSAHVWTCRADGPSVLLGRDGIAEVEVFQRPGILDLALAFSQSMQPHIAWDEGDGLVWMRWFDGSTGQYRIDAFGAGRSPRLCLDDKREALIDKSDVILAYVTPGDRLVYRMQREQFGIEHDAGSAGRGGRIVRMGMSRSNSLQFVVRSMPDLG